MSSQPDASARGADGGWCIEFAAMASPCRIRLAGCSEAQARRWADLAIAEVRRIEHAYSRYRADSIVSRINAAAGSVEPVPVDAETAHLLDFAATLFDASEGRFDLTSGVLRQAWDFKQAPPAQLPGADRIAAALARVGWQQVEWDGAAIRLPRPGMELDFGGFGKEYAVDRATTRLIEAGARSGVVNLGGDLRVLGPCPDGRPWRLGIAHPRPTTAQTDAVIADWPLTHGALATSGDCERFIEVDGRRYGHILDARSGWPVSHWQSVSVAAPACLAAGSLTTIAMLMGADALDWLGEQGLPYLAIDAQGRIHDGRCAP
ncbi:MAG: FAD:protein FMN transferase [Leptothrix sp. (in: b-proteobacteria)]